MHVSKTSKGQLKKTKSKKGLLVFAVLLLLIILIILIASLSVPSKEQHTLNIEQQALEHTSGYWHQYSDFTTEESSLQTQGDHYNDSNKIAIRLLKNFHDNNTITMNKTWFWSTAIISNVSNPTSIPVSFGIFNMTFSDVEFNEIELVNYSNNKLDLPSPSQNQHLDQLNNQIDKTATDSPILDQDINKPEQSTSNYDRDYARKLNNIGTEFYQKKNYSQALQYYEKAIEAYPLFAQAYANLALTSIKHGYYDNAYRYSFMALNYNDDPTFEASCYYNIATVYEKQNNLPNALYFYKQALEYNNSPIYAKAYNRLKQIVDQEQIQDQD